MILFFTVGMSAEATNTLSDAEIQGRSLVRQLLEQAPVEDFIHTGVLKIKRAKAGETNFPVRCEVIVTPTNWSSIYILNYPTNENIRAIGLGAAVLQIRHADNQTSEYFLNDGADAGIQLKGAEIYRPFGNSDFWFADLGLEFLRWPQQKILPKTISLKRGRAYTLLESTNPNRSTNGYARVLSWIDKESGGILEAEAYDPSGKLLKVFAPKSFKKVNGDWQLQEMEIRNVQTGSRTRLEFDLGKSE